ncbi:MAG: DUF763 domain-containing protein [Desulfurococcales archaeon]|nr:DUF763 domain-containing protein [Desulfurococcales archaeon]
MLEGIAELPLHEGHVPQWLARIMKRLAKAIIYIMIDEYGPDKTLKRLVNPLWFQAFNNAIAMDWDSSGSTTVTLGILKEVTWSNRDLGIIVVGGKGRRARQVPNEIPHALRQLGLSEDQAPYYTMVSKLVAKIDSAALQDKYTLYHHTLIISNTGKWVIIQQGMNLKKKLARRYHWSHRTSFTSKPHESVSGYRLDHVLNLVDQGSHRIQKTIVDLVNDNPLHILSDYKTLYNIVYRNNKTLHNYLGLPMTSLSVLDKKDHIVYYRPLPLPDNLLRKLKIIYSKQPSSFRELLLTRNVGASTIRALALISDLIYNEPPSWRDPVDTPYDPFKYSFVIGGKDGIPYPVDPKKALEVIKALEEIIERARIDKKDKYRALKRLRKLVIYSHDQLR